MEQASRREREEKEQELATKVRQIDFEQVQLKVQADMDMLLASVPNAQQSAIESAKDMKYLKERQEHLGLYDAKGCKRNDGCSVPKGCS